MMFGGTLGGYPNFGMSLRFSVEVEGLETPCHLGLWHSCKNLQLDLHTEKVSAGGTSLMDRRLPGKIEYSAITLERPVEEKSSKQLQAWLQDYVENWDKYESTPYSRGAQHRSVIIKLLDYQLNEVMRWTLEDAYPTKWIGPSLSATDNTVAMETLVIEHSGFLSHTAKPDQAKLSPDTGATGTPIEFHFNPEKLTLEHESELGERSSVKAELTKIMPPSLSMPDLIFDGTGTLACCEQLLEWSNPMLKGEEYYLPPLIFEWGKFTATGSVPVTLTKVKIDYGRFDQEGRPTRAAASLTLRRNDPGTPGQQNPTSGGLPGRSGHVMVNGETMPGIALGAYGNPARWRAVAAANQVDDPLRVRPGSVLYLPARAELARAELAAGGVA